ncbi:unknown [[Mannheimia] succiniciproducens MBEL55E]|uniref:Uncharacterized protein n=1 Tax=Mannheimia succiniciproducens (strain KCTC 0769BP / MBEL55E) TaxID=221988 RepID=Q65VK4_MANSM|nr:unknown [[Mannheimia] succiniciproducens MBEL55E]
MSAGISLRIILLKIVSSAILCFLIFGKNLPHFLSEISLNSNLSRKPKE